MHRRMCVVVHDVLLNTLPQLLNVLLKFEDFNSLSLGVSSATARQITSSVVCLLVLKKKQVTSIFASKSFLAMKPILNLMDTLPNKIFAVKVQEKFINTQCITNVLCWCGL